MQVQKLAVIYKTGSDDVHFLFFMHLPRLGLLAVHNFCTPFLFLYENSTPSSCSQGRVSDFVLTLAKIRCLGFTPRSESFAFATSLQIAQFPRYPA